MTSAFVHWKSATFVLSRNSNINLILVISILDSCEGYDVIILAHDVTNKILSRSSNLYCRCGHVTTVWQLKHFNERSYHNLNFIRI